MQVERHVIDEIPINKTDFFSTAICDASRFGLTSDFVSTSFAVEVTIEP